LRKSFLRTFFKTTGQNNNINNSPCDITTLTKNKIHGLIDFTCFKYNIDSYFQQPNYLADIFSYEAEATDTPTTAKIFEIIEIETLSLAQKHPEQTQHFINYLIEGIENMIFITEFSRAESTSPGII